MERVFDITRSHLPVLTVVSMVLGAFVIGGSSMALRNEVQMMKQEILRDRWTLRDMERWSVQFGRHNSALVVPDPNDIKKLPKE